MGDDRPCAGSNIDGHVVALAHSDDERVDIDGLDGESICVRHGHAVSADGEAVCRVTTGVDDTQPNSIARSWERSERQGVCGRSAVDQMHRIDRITGVATEER